jgi:hypothetical protein
VAVAQVEFVRAQGYFTKLGLRAAGEERNALQQLDLRVLAEVQW